MAKAKAFITILFVSSAMFACVGVDTNKTIRGAATGAAVGGATNYVLGKDVVEGAAAGGVAGTFVSLFN